MDTETLLNVIAMLNARIIELQSKLKWKMSCDEFMDRTGSDWERSDYLHDIDPEDYEEQMHQYDIIEELENFRDHLQSGVEAQISAMETAMESAQGI